jgi:hypothetical protein
MKKRKMSALQRKYFGKKHRAHTTHKGGKKLAKKSFRRHFGGAKAGLKGAIAPILGGVADSYLDPMLPIDGVGGAAVGMFMHNETVKNIGLYKVGYSLGNILPLPRFGGNTSGGGGL